MPYKPIRCPTCGSTKTIAAENNRFYCASCDGWFVWTDASHAKYTDPSQQQTIETMQKELRELRKLVKENAEITDTPTTDPLEFSRAQLCKFQHQDWFYEAWNGETKGPVTFSRLLELERAGEITRHSNIKARNQPWTSLTKLLEYATTLRSLRHSASTQSANPVATQAGSQNPATEIVTDWKTPAGYIAISVGILAFISSWLANGREATPFDGFLNPLFYIGVFLGWWWLEEAKQERESSNKKPNGGRQPPPPQTKPIPKPPHPPKAQSEEGPTTVHAPAALQKKTTQKFSTPHADSNEASDKKESAPKPNPQNKTPTATDHKTDDSDVIAVGAILAFCALIGLFVLMLSVGSRDRRNAALKTAQKEDESPTVPARAVSKGRFTVWTEPTAPDPGQRYKVMIEAKLKKGLKRIPRSDITGNVKASDGYTDDFGGPEETGYYTAKDGAVRFHVVVPGAVELVKDVITVESKLLDERQVIELVFGDGIESKNQSGSDSPEEQTVQKPAPKETPSKTLDESSSPPLQKFWTIGSSRETVKAIQGKPSSKKILFPSDRRQRSASNSHQSKIAKAPQPLDAAATLQGRLTATGQPYPTDSRVGNYEVWYYNSSDTVTFHIKTNSVCAWKNNSGRLWVIVGDGPKPHAKFAQGSTIEKVLAAEGTPKSVTTYNGRLVLWFNERDTVTIDPVTNKVVNWNNRSGQLRLISKYRPSQRF